MFKSTAGALVFLLAAVSAAPHQDGDLPPPRSVIDQRFFIFGPPPGWGEGPDVEGRGRFGCDNPHPYCKKDNHPKEACTDWGEGWKGWMEENCPEKCGKCGGGGGGPPPPPGPSGPGREEPQRGIFSWLHKAVKTAKTVWKVFKGDKDKDDKEEEGAGESAYHGPDDHDHDDHDDHDHDDHDHDDHDDHDHDHDDHDH